MSKQQRCEVLLEVMVSAYSTVRAIFCAIFLIQFQQLSTGITESFSCCLKPKDNIVSLSLSRLSLCLLFAFPSQQSVGPDFLSFL